MWTARRLHLCLAGLTRVGSSEWSCCDAADGYGSARGEMTAEEEQQIRERAYSIWEQEGRPHGRDVDHRLRAEAEIAAERSRGGVTAQQHQVRGNDRERLTNARKAAEALFTEKRQRSEQSIREGLASTVGSVRKP